METTVDQHSLSETAGTGNHEHGALLMPGIEQPLMQVVPYHADQWGQALARGQRRGISIERGKTVHQLGCEMRGYVVPDHRSTGRRTGVVVVRDYAGDVWVGCGCTDHALRRSPCLHAALAIADAGWWPQGLITTRGRDDFEDLDDVGSDPLPASSFYDLDLATQDLLTKRQQVGMAGYR